MKHENSQTKTEEILNILTTSKRFSVNSDSDRGAEFYNSILQTFLKSKIIKHFSRFTEKGLSIAEQLIRTTRNLLKKPVIEKGNASWITELPAVIKQYHNTVHLLIKRTPVHASKKVNEEIVFFQSSRLKS